MAKQLIILVAQVKYPSTNATYLTANSHVIESGDWTAHEVAVKDFKSRVEVDGFTVTNMIAYIVPKEHIKDATTPTE
jgi:hypothetical protein